MAGFFDYLFGNMLSPNNAQNMPLNPGINIPQPGMTPIQQNPMMGMRNPMGPAPSNPMLNSKVPPPPYAVAAGIAPQAQPSVAGLPNSNPMQMQNQQGLPGARSPDDMLKKAMMMQALMGEEPEAIQGPNGALPSGVGLKGQGGFQNDPAVGLLNSFPPQMQPRKRFIGSGY